MTSPTLCVSLAVLLLSVGCARKTATPAPGTDAREPRPEQTAADPGDLPSDETAALFRGLFRATADGALEWVPCSDPTKTYWVLGDTEALERAATDLTVDADGYAGQSVMARVRGRLRSVGDGGSAPRPSGYDAQLVVSGVDRVEGKNRRNYCLDYELWAFGNEPFWSLYVSAAEGVAELTRLGAPTMRFAYAEPVVEDEGRLTRYFLRGDTQRLKVRVEREACSDTMAGNRYPYRVEVEVAGETLRGCGEPRGEASD